MTTRNRRKTLVTGRIRAAGIAWNGSRFSVERAEWDIGLILAAASGLVFAAAAWKFVMSAW